MPARSLATCRKLPSKHPRRIPKPVIICYSGVIDACAICGDLGQAAEWLSKAQEAGLNANIISHKIQCQHLRAMPRLGVGCCVFFQSAGDWAEA